MDGKIYDLLKKIDGFTIAKFGLSKDDRIFLKQLLLDESYLNDFIEIYGIDKVNEFLVNIYNDLCNINLNIDKLNRESDDNIQKHLNALFSKEINDLEKEKEEKIELLIKNKILKEKIKEQELNDLELYNKIKQSLNN